MEEVKFSNSELLTSYLKYYFPDISKDEGAYEQAYQNLLKINKTIFRDHLRKLRKFRKIGQQEIANKLGITLTSYSAWELGRHLPKIEYVKQLAYILKVDAVEFICSSFDELTHLKSVPIIYNSFTSSMNFNDFCKNLVEYSKDPFIASYRKVPKVENIDFCYFVRDTNMGSENEGIPKGSIVYCEYSSLSKLNHEERLLAANNKVALISFKKGDCYLKDIKYDGKTLIISERNNEFRRIVVSKENNVQTNKNYQLTLKDLELSKNIFYVEDIEVFAIAKRVVLDLDELDYNEKTIF